ncbi:SAM-dependent methyltransferase [Pseudonocardia sp. CA-107938]|uniref:SAM-dependent methyltransferase n=1 Tax=Pseudonocardia sp. CA-107938 TaxID=3240021 RepID=UPI003D8A70E3
MTANEDELRTDVPHSARVWNYWLGGEDNFPVDQAVGDAVLAYYPGIATVARQAREFLQRAVRLLAGELGVDQFLDVGSGLPTTQNTHQLAQALVPEARVVYVDHDPLVLARARTLLTDTSPTGATAYVDADVRDTERILAEARTVLDFDRPIAVMFLGIFGYLPDLDEARAIVRTIMDAVPPGSYLVVRDHTDLDATAGDASTDYTESGMAPYHLRSVDELRTFFDGLELVEPGFVRVAQWRPDPGETVPATADHAGLARKP